MDDVTFAEFCALCARLEATRSRLDKVAWCGDFLRRLSVSEVPWAIAFLTARPFPASDPRVLEVGWAAVRAAEEAAPAAVATLSMLDVAEGFGKIASRSGKGSRLAKAEALRELFAKATLPEREFLKRILQGEMRIGLHDGLVQEAIAAAFGAPLSLIRRAGLFLSDLSEVARIAATEGVAGLERVGIKLFVPLLPMLSETAEDFVEILEAHGGRTALEYKYDGARIQIHKEGPRVRIWSRRLTEVTQSLPDIVEVAGAMRAGSCILDAEVVALGRNGRPLAFQELMRRFRRVHGIERSAAEVPLGLYAFDCLLLDGEPLIDRPYAERWERLRQATDERYLAERQIVSDIDSGRAFLQRALDAGHEGVMAKQLESPYAPGSRGKRWFKLKPAVTVDCVILAADRGSGRRRGWLSNYHLAVVDDAGGFAPVGKTFKGLTDAEFKTMTARLEQLRVADDGYTVTVKPEVVVEVAFNEIQRSPQYSSGFALRFARIVRVREDKRPDQATTLAEVRQLFERQFLTKSRFEI
ncbi:MAG TPA: ATP-dependent DNA ligase [candidate division Zixibacteria bacterium]|nr:ATP-dependent DNA ligase [candidate division Zixibacteria bacterium]